MSSDSAKTTDDDLHFPPPTHRRRRESDEDTTTTTDTEKKSVVDGDEEDSIPPTPTSPPLPPPLSRPNAGGIMTSSPGEKEEKDGGPIHPARSTASSSMRPRHATPVPREHRRGLLPWMALVPEVDEPVRYSNGVKWMLTIFVAAAACAAPMGSAIFYRKFFFFYINLYLTHLLISVCY